MTRVAILGDGGWGTALALVLRENGHEVRVWGPFPDYIAEIQRTHENRKFLPGVRMPTDIVWTGDRAEAVADSEIIVLAVPSRFFRGVAAAFSSLVPRGAAILSVSKGLDPETHRRLSETAEECLGRGPVAVLSGPSHAEEVARGLPTAVVVACREDVLARHFQAVFNRPTFRVYTSTDVVGAELGGALKNIIAIAAGISDGIGLGDNAKAALMTRGLAEITRLGVALGARPGTFAGLSGMGDLIVTCTSRWSRNRAVGERIGRGEKIENILASMEQVAEGVWTCRAARALAQERDVEVPITNEVYAVIHEGKDPRAAVQALLSRDPRPERD